MSTDPSQYYVIHNTIVDGRFQRILVEEIIQHEDYNEDFFIQNDICILKTEPFEINETVQPACLGKVLCILDVRRASDVGNILKDLIPVANDRIFHPQKQSLK